MCYWNYLSYLLPGSWVKQNCNMSKLVQIILSKDSNLRDQSLDSVCSDQPLATLVAECDALEEMRKENENLYEKVRALFFLYAIHRFHIPSKEGISEKSILPYVAFEHILTRRFDEAIDLLLRKQNEPGPNRGISSTLAEAY